VESQPVAAYVRTQGIIAAVINMVFNPLISWLLNRGMESMPLAVCSGILVDAAATSVILSLLVSLFVTAGVRRDVTAGRVETGGELSGEGRLLSRLPRKAWVLGLAIGSGVALLLVPFIYGLFRLIGVAGLRFGNFVLFKAVYTALMGFIVTRWVVLRQLPCEAAARQGVSRAPGGSRTSEK